MRALGLSLGRGWSSRPSLFASRRSFKPRDLARCAVCKMAALEPPHLGHGGCRLSDSRPEQGEGRQRAACQLVDDTLFARDELKEGSRTYQRTLSSFSWDRWASHRSTWRYVRHMRGIFKSSIVRGLAAPLAYVGALATLVCCYEQMLLDGVLPDWLPSLQMPTAPFDLTSFALALLLVFRTNTSYDRWSTVCSLWGSIANRSRDTLRQVLSCNLRGGLESPLPPAAARWLVAYCRALKAQLTEDSDLRKELQGVLEPAELDVLCASWHPPSFALAVLSELVGHAAGRAEGLRESQCTRLDENLTAFEDVVGACERILRTPIPLSYTRHTSRFLVIWLSCLPLGLWAACGWATISLSLVIAFLLLGIEEIGVQIEEPFGLLPLGDLCEEIEGDLYAMLRESSAAKTAAARAAMGGNAARTVAAAALGGTAGRAESDSASAGAPGPLEGMASNPVALLAAVRRKLEGTVGAGIAGGDSSSGHSGSHGGSGVGVAGGLAAAGAAELVGKHMEWAEVHGRRGADQQAAVNAIFCSLDDGDV